MFSWMPELFSWLVSNSEVARNLATTFGIIIGGSFALYKFVFEGAFSDRLPPNVSVAVSSKDGQVYMRVEVTAENIGSSKVRLDSEVTSLSVSFATADSEGWTAPYNESVMEDQQIIQPGETVVDQVWIEVEDTGLVAAQMKFYLSDRRRLFRRSESVWVHREVVDLINPRTR